MNQIDSFVRFRKIKRTLQNSYIMHRLKKRKFSFSVLRSVEAQNGKKKMERISKLSVSQQYEIAGGKVCVFHVTDCETWTQPIAIL